MAGIVVACAALVAMPLLSMPRNGLVSSSEVGQCCRRGTGRLIPTFSHSVGWLGFEYPAGWWWADPVAARIMTPIIAKKELTLCRESVLPERPVQTK